MRQPDPEEALSDSVVKQRAKSGVFFVGSFGAVNLIVGFLGSIVLARMLLPRDFGVVAIGTTLIMVTTSLADGGLASGLIRRAERPRRGELSAALALQLALTIALAGIAASVGIAVGGSGLVVALMMAGLPVAALQTPGRILLSRELRFRVLATVEASGILAYYVWAVAGVIAGLGVWALASAVLARAVISACGVMWVSRLGLLRPSFRDIRALRPVIAFGLRFQAVSLAGMGREQGLNAGIAAIAGISTLGYWTLTRRLLEVPVLMFEPLHRVSFPFLSRMRAARQDPTALLDRGVAVAGTASGIVLVAAAAAAPELVPAVFGAQWEPVAPIFQWVCASLLVAGPLAVVAVGFLYSVDAPSAVLKATVVHTVVLFAVAFSLLPALGPEAIGIGSLAGAVTDACLMARAMHARSAARPLKALWPTLAVAAPAAGLGMVVTSVAPAGLIAAAAGGLAAAAAYVAMLAVVRRAILVETTRLIADAVRSALTRESSPASQQELGQREAVPAATPS